MAGFDRAKPARLRRQQRRRSRAPCSLPVVAAVVAFVVTLGSRSFYTSCPHRFAAIYCNRQDTKAIRVYSAAIRQPESHLLSVFVSLSRGGSQWGRLVRVRLSRLASGLGLIVWLPASARTGACVHTRSSDCSPVPSPLRSAVRVRSAKVTYSCSESCPCDNPRERTHPCPPRHRRPSGFRRRSSPS